MTRSVLQKLRIACCKSGENGAFYSVQTSLYVHGYLVSTLKQNVDHRSDILNTPACHFVSSIAIFLVFHCYRIRLP